MTRKVPRNLPANDPERVLLPFQRQGGTPSVEAMDYAVEIAERAQNWHETDHGARRGKPIKGNKFRQPGEDDVPESVPASFRVCPLCRPSEPEWALAAHVNPFWYRAVAQESDG